MPEPDASGLGSPSFSSNADDSFSNPGSHSILGTNQLQAAIDKFDAAVTKLSQLYDKAASSMPVGGSQSNAAGISSNAGGASITNASQGAGGKRAGFLGLPSMQSGTTDAAAPGAAAPGSGFMGQYSINGQPSGGSQGSGSQLANGVSGFMGQHSINGQPSGSSGQGNGQGSNQRSGVASGFIATAAAIGSFGAARLPDSTSMTNMTWRGNLIGGAPGTGGWNQAASQRAGAFGAGGVGVDSNALNASDAAAGYSAAQQWSGSAMPYKWTNNNRVTFSNPTASAMYGASSSFGAANPALGSAGSMQMAGALYNPQMSMRMMQLGYGKTPLNMNGKHPSQMGGVVQSMMGRMFPGQQDKKGAVNPKNLAGSMAPGQVGYENLAQLGMSPEQISEMTSTMEMYNTSSKQTGKSFGQLQSMFEKYRVGDKSTKSQISKELGPNIMKSMKEAEATKTGQTSDVNTQFAQGVDKAAQGLAKFNNAMDKVLQNPLMKLIVGGGGGAAGAFSALGSGATIGAGAFGASKLLGLLLGKGSGEAGVVGKALGMGSKGAGAAEGAGGAGAAEGAGGAGAAGGAGGASGLAGTFAAALGSSAVMVAVNKMADVFGKSLGQKITNLLHLPSLNKLPGPVKQTAANTAKSIGDMVPQLGAVTNLVKGALGFAEGGRVRGGTPGKDTVHIMAQDGETVLNPKASQKLGYDVIDKLNRENPNPAGKTEMKDGILHAAGGAAILQDAKKYAGHKYVWGGPSNPKGGWDCSSFASYVLGHDEGYKLPGGKTWDQATSSGKTHGPTSGSFAGMPGAHKVSNSAKDIQAGDLLVWPTHVGFGVGPGTMFSAYDTAKGTLQTPKDMQNASGPSGEKLTVLRLGAGGGNANSSGGGSGSSSSSSNSGSSQTNTGGGSPSSTSETDNVLGALGAGAYASSASAPQQSKTTSNGGGGAPAGGVTGSAAANGKELYQYLLTNLFGGKKIAAAGAIASIWGESGWNPMSQGTGGRGLIGWTPPSSISDAAFKGGMKTQLPEIINFVHKNGDMGAVHQMEGASTILDAANIWGKKVERYGINDVHSAGIAAAKKIAGLATGGVTQKPGPYLVGERGPEVVDLPSGASVTDAKRTSVSGAQGVAQTPWKVSVPQPAASSKGAQVNLTFGDVVIQTQNGNINKQDVANSVREIYAGVTKMIENDKVIQAIANGEKRG